VFRNVGHFLMFFFHLALLFIIKTEFPPSIPISYQILDMKVGINH